MLNKAVKFILFGYGKVYSELLRKENSRNAARFSAVVQFSLIITLNFLSILFIAVPIITGILPANSFVVLDGFSILEVLFFIGGSLILLTVNYISKKYNDDYERAYERGEQNLKRYVDLYPYVVVIFLIVSICFYIIY